MVTHELLGTIKGANAELDMLKAALVDMTAQRDARMDMTTLAGMGAGGGMSAANAEEYQTLKVKGEESTETYLYGGRTLLEPAVRVFRKLSSHSRAYVGFLPRLTWTADCCTRFI